MLNSANARYLTDRSGAPFPLLGRASWMVLSLPRPAYRRYLDDTQRKGFDAVEVSALSHWPDGDHAPLDGAGNAPFVRSLDGAVWTGALHYVSIVREAPDFTAPNEAYWHNVDQFLDDCASRGIVVLLFPSYVGYAKAHEGWMEEMVANGAQRMRVYGAWVATRYRQRKNIIWMLGGDRGTPPFDFTPAELAVEQAFIDGLTGVPGQASMHRSAEWSGPTATSQPDFASYITLDGAYGRNTAAFSRQAYVHAPVRPAFLLEEPYDEEGPDGNWRNVDATQPVRRFEWSGWLNSIGGYVAGNGFVWPFRNRWWHLRSYYGFHLNTRNTRDLVLLNQFIRSVSWYQLVPEQLGAMGTLITSGRGMPDALDYVSAAATPDGRLLIAYAGPARRSSFAVDLSKLHGSATARWFNPTSGVYSPIGTFPNDHVQEFAVPGDNGSGYYDWVLIITSP